MRLLLFIEALLLLVALQQATAVQLHYNSEPRLCSNLNMRVFDAKCEIHGFILYSKCLYHCDFNDRLWTTDCTRHLFGKHTFQECSNICCVTPPSKSTTTTTSTTSTPSCVVERTSAQNSELMESTYPETIETTSSVEPSESSTETGTSDASGLQVATDDSSS
ncbi:uncharacterized protein LOC116805960 [Drosophila grimshawi]|uniref:uncharacterized protein LOC116805960 n=1 Tax=Drosophila grimshawi TaxID=7222 RepID=UPI000C870BAE|nr:uncharacterized protein LOC116805960 [Drosophila grimshawi]